MKNVKNIGIVGGGTAGFVAALILKRRFPEMNIDMIVSSKIGIIGVGEGSTEHWKEFTEFIGVDTYTLIKECDSTCKLGIMFDNWTDKPYFHSVQTEYNQFAGQYPYVYARQIAHNEDPRSMSKGLYWDNKVESWYVGQPDLCPAAQFHFNTNKLNDFLTKLALERGIRIFDDEIVDVNLSEDGEISTLKGNKKEYNYDFYLDCTGFRKMLISKLGAKWNSYGKYLKMKAAIAFPTPDTENYNIYTLARALDYGWMFRLPVWGRGGNGYIYDSDYITKDQAKAEVEAHLGHEIEVGKEFNFDPGGLDRVWIKNCVAIGVSASFIEPMEASSIGTSIQQAFLLMHRIANYDDHSIKVYNKAVTDILENIRDFVALHYVTKKRHNDFWKDVAAMELPDRLQGRLEVWKHKLPMREDFSDTSDYVLFKESHHTLVLQGLGLFDRNSIRREFETVEAPMQDHAHSIVSKLAEYEKTSKTITHKEYIKSIRDFNYAK